MRCDAGSLALRKVDNNNNTHTHTLTNTHRNTSRGAWCGGINKAQSVARVSASVTNSPPANAAHSPYSSFCLSLLIPYVFLPPFLSRLVAAFAIVALINSIICLGVCRSSPLCLALSLFLPLSLTFSSFAVCFVASFGQTLLVAVAFLTRLP